MSTVEAPVQSSESQGKKRRRTKKDNYLESKGLQSLAAPPVVPDEYDPSVFLTLKEDDFDDLLDAKRHEKNVLSYELGLVEAEIIRLESVPEESRADYAKTQDHLNTALAFIRKMQKTGADVSDFMAQIQTEMGG